MWVYVGLLAIINLELVPSQAYAAFPAFLPFLKCTLEVVFCESIQHRLRFSLDQHICTKLATHQFHLQSEKQKKIEWVGPTVMLLWSKIPS
jgi:uncharacterized Fe-S radical SAM superfamily protein PflX